MKSLVIFSLIFVIATSHGFAGHTWTNIQGALAAHQWPSLQGPTAQIHEQPKPETSWTNIQGAIAQPNIWPMIKRLEQAGLQVTAEKQDK